MLSKLSVAICKQCSGTTLHDSVLCGLQGLFSELSSPKPCSLDSVNACSYYRVIVFLFCRHPSSGRQVGKSQKIMIMVSTHPVAEIWISL